MPTHTTADNVTLAYDMVGNGPAIVLLHGGGGGQSRRSWFDTGYVDRLKQRYTVIAIDIRGHGESDKPISAEAYNINRMCDDVLEVTEACGVEQFVLWGFSYGSNIGRFLAVRSARVTKLVVTGIPFGAAASGTFRAFINDFRNEWAESIAAFEQGQLDLATFSAEQHDEWQQFNIPCFVAWLTAMLDWGSVEPTELHCPTLWIAGSENTNTVSNMHTYGDALAKTNVLSHIEEGLNHREEFEQIERMLPIVLDFIEFV